MSFKIEKQYFSKNGKLHFLLSGEIHYFRINPKDWDKHLKLLKKSGANATSTYIPWDWHEYEKGKFDFSGLTHPARDLLKYIDLCKKNDLDLIVKPGPYILAEYELQGLPSWLKENCSKNAFALDFSGNIISDDIMSYMSEEFLNYVFLWYDKIMPIIEINQISNNGPIIMMQVCNEVGVFQWLNGKIDYNPTVIKLYKEFLIKKYSSVENLNVTYKTDYKTFDEVPVPNGNIENKVDYCGYFDFHIFYRFYYALYFNTLVKKIRSFKIDLVLTHNIPGWIYGNASELPMLISTYSQIFKSTEEVIFGLDHIPEFVSYRNAHSDLACNKFLEAFQTNKPIWAAEFQCGSREHQVKSDVLDLQTFYYASVAHGLNGFNYYMFSQGINPSGKGFFGKTFYYQTALNYQGVTSELYNVIKKINRFIIKENDNLLLSSTKSDICVALYQPYFYTELISSQLLKEKKLNISKLNLKYDHRFVREEMLFNGLLRILQTLNFNYDIKDIENTPLKTLMQYKQMWLLTTDFMNKEAQNKLVAYVNEGGNLILSPILPYLDDYLNPCNNLEVEFNITNKFSVSSNKISAFNIEEIYTTSNFQQIYNGSKNEILAKTKSGETCGIRKNIGKGTLTLFGFGINYSTDEHLKFIEKIVSLNKIKKEIKINDPDVQFVLRKGKKYNYLFLLNYHNSNKTIRRKNKTIKLKPFSCKIIKEYK